MQVTIDGVEYGPVSKNDYGEILRLRRELHEITTDRDRLKASTEQCETYYKELIKKNSQLKTNVDYYHNQLNAARDNELVWKIKWEKLRKQVLEIARGE